METRRIAHAGTGPDFQILQTSRSSWDWRELVAQLDPQSRGEVFSRANYIMGSYFVTRPGEHGPTAYTLWDFIICRDDGKAIALHPERKKSKFSATQLDEELPVGPNGKTTFKYIRASLGGITLRFDPARR